jgi:hypothetical protein
VTFFDVFEHLDDHESFIGRVQDLLKDGGYIAMSMPYRKHAEWFMRADVPPRHLTRWDRTALTNFLKAHGFDVVYIRRIPADIRFIIVKLRFKYGRRTSIGLVNAVRAKTSGSTSMSNGKSSPIVRLARFVAAAKDAMLFGIPAIIIWIALLPSSQRYLTLYAIARKTETGA